MTPKEKAKELVEKYYYLFSIELENTIDYRDAKQCALIAVDLAIEYNDFHIEFLQEVKQEIEKLC
jgi:hypothetical protein